MMLAIRSGATLAILALLTLAGGPAPVASGDAPTDGITYVGDILTITTTADRTGILRLQALSPTGHFPSYHYDPGRSIGGTIRIEGFRGYRDYHVSSVSETELRGTISAVLCIPGYCKRETWSFLLSGPVDTPPGPSDSLFAGTVSSGGTITVAMDSRGVTAFTLESVPLEPCTEPDNPLDIHAFDFPVYVERGSGNYLPLALVEVEGRDDGAGQLLTGKISFCDALFPWTAELVVGPTTTPPPVTPTPPPPTATAVAPTSAPAAAGTPTSTTAATPAPTSAVLASQLPSAGAPTDDASRTLPAVFAVAGALLLAGGLFAARRRA